MRARNIKPGYFKSDELAELPPLTRILFAGLWCVADRSGRLEDRPKRIKADVLPYDDCDVDAMLDELAGAGFVLRYETASGRFIQVVNFDKHQNPHKNEAPSTIEAPEQYGTSTVQAPESHTTNPADSLIPDSLIPDTGFNGDADAPRAPNPRDLHWDTQVEIFGFSPTRDTPEHGRWQKSTGIWRKLKATPEQMLLAADLYVQAFPDAAFTAIALAGRAEQLLKGHKPNPPPRIEDIKNPMMQSLATVDLSDITAEEAERDSRRHLQAQNGRSGVLPTAPRRIGDGGQPPQPDVLPAARQSRHG